MRNIINTVLSAACALMICGCTFDERLTQPVKEGVPTTVQLGYSVDGALPMTRAEQDASYENDVNNLYVFVFDSNGSRVRTTDDNDNDRSFFQESDMSITHGDGTPGNLTNGTIRFKVGSVLDATIIGIANLTTETTTTAFRVTKGDMDAITTLDELSSYVMRMEDGNTIERNALFMMTGYAVDNATGRTAIDIVGNEGGTTELSCSIRLTRVDAKIRVNITSSPKDPTWRNFSFEPRTWRVMRVPSQTLLLPYDQTSGKTVAGPWLDSEGVAWDATVNAEYFDTQERPFETMDRTEDDNTQYYTGGSFVFYMPENRKRFREEITVTGNEGYALREESNTVNEVDGSKPGQIYTNTDFKYADPNSTYLILTGYLSYTAQNGTVVNTDARYIVHLGYYSKDPNDYDTKRNGDYTYNITVTGVNSLQTEVINGAEDREDRPGYEGDVVYSNNEIYYLDSHYDRCLLEILPSDVTDAMTWSVKTPFSSGVHTVGDKSYKGVEDFRWIKFAINKKYGIPHTRYAKYPGDDKYDPDWKPVSADLNDVPQLVDIDQLIEYLKLVKKDDPSMSRILADGTTDGHVCITAFVDENLYYYDPVTDPFKTNPQPQLWHDCVDRDDRMMHIVVPEDGMSDGYYSPDGNTSVVTSLYSFIQKSIRTVFNAENRSLQTAWGLESVMEGSDNGYQGRLPVGDVSSAAVVDNYNRNGRKNSLTWMEGKLWTDVIQTSERYGLNSDYEYATYACLLRNRDFDGDNVVDGDEVRWYLAAIDQLTDIFLGEWALDEASRLYPYDPKNGQYPPTGKVYWHYTSSSPDGGNPNVLWAEEGASRGSFSTSIGLNGDRYAYRCIRNLGIDINDTKTDPDDLVTVNSNGDGTYTIDLSRMNPKSLRTSYDGGVPLPLGDEKSLNNRPYTKFIVGADAYGLGGPDGDIISVRNGVYTFIGTSHISWDWTNEGTWVSYQNYNPCPDGYRMPNQRELLIMSTRLDHNEGWPQYEASGTAYSWGSEYTDVVSNLRPEYYMCQTSFSMNGMGPYSNGLREGFMWVYDNGVFMLQNDRGEVGYVRCVKDTN